MNTNNIGDDATSRRIIEEIAFQANILALHAAIASACDGVVPIASSQNAEAQIDEQVHGLVERERRTAGKRDACRQHDRKGL